MTPIHGNRTSSRWSRQILALLMACLPALATAAFWDQGFKRPRFMTDYPSTDEGTASNPLTLVSPCLYPATDPLGIGGTCHLETAEFPVSNHFTMNGARPDRPHWTLVMNNEPWFRSKSGPPDQSLPRTPPGLGVMGFDAFKGSVLGEPFHRAHLVLDNSFNNTDLHEDGAYSIPFLGISGDQRAGNGEYPGRLNAPFHPSTLYFTAALWDLYPPELDPELGFYLGALFTQLWVFAEWEGKPRGIFFTLYNFNVSFSHPEGDPLRPASLPFSKFHWAWPIEESFFHPGGDLVFGEIDAIDQACGGVLGPAQRLNEAGQQRSYLIDLQTVFRCVSDLGGFDSPMPAFSPVPILGVGWANELTGPDTALWTSIHGMRMLWFPVPAFDKATSAKGEPASWPEDAPDETGAVGPPGEQTLAIQRALVEQCLQRVECAAQHQSRLSSGERLVVDPFARYPFHSMQAVRDFARSRRPLPDSP
jgi:hypothetical protein